ncbi:hypothetical protein [Micromonospora sp. CB01531]|uniref:hypothetical protein n=1 Tax=Micromonospora sp. CB01531 TaxID=1718947 RepID=UPI0009596DA4|nr:hypothetical protein [Micromonospora sp. CB01531]OKI58179.1 hypothetical protein A6A27_30100 [Micromonospora sp. CB01531]
MIAPFAPAVQRLTEIPGIKATTAHTLIAEIEKHVDQSGAATAYPHRGGAYLSRRSAGPEARQSWANAPTAVYPQQRPLMTPGQLSRGHGGRMPR